MTGTCPPTTAAAIQDHAQGTDPRHEKEPAKRGGGGRHRSLAVDEVVEGGKGGRVG